MRRNDNQEKSL